MQHYLGIDLGGTNIAVGVLDESYRIVARARLKTRAIRPAAEICDDMTKAAHMAAEQAGVSITDLPWVGVGSPGSVDPVSGVVGYANNLGFRDVPLAAMMGERLGVTVYTENDANAAAYGEALAGAAKGVNNVLAITLGTGVGGGVILNGKIFSGRDGTGSELGHMGIVVGGRPCSCGRNGCVEAYASATGLIQLTRQAMEQHPESRLWELAPALDRVDGKTAFDAMRLGDTVGTAVVDEYVEYLAYGLVNYINIFAPELIVLGGGISREGEPFLERLRRAIDGQVYGGVNHTRLACATLGNDAGIIGAALLGKNAAGNP